MKIDRRTFIAGAAILPMPALARGHARVFNAMILDGDGRMRVLKSFRMPLEPGFENALGLMWDDYLLLMRRYVNEATPNPLVREWYAVYETEWARDGNTDEVVVTGFYVYSKIPGTQTFTLAAELEGDGPYIHPLVRKLPPHEIWESALL